MMSIVSRDLPTGTVTLLFTDIEGSTRLLREHGDRYADLLAEHRLALRAAFSAHSGVEVDTQGDAFFVAFGSAVDAVSAAAAAQRSLAMSPVRVRIGIHTGEPVVTDEGYVGLAVHEAARIAAAGHGGQTVLSLETRAHLQREFELLDLGEHRVKDFDGPVGLFQLGTEAFPPLRTISNTNLPRPASSFVGRQPEVREIARLIGGESRLVTLTGPGGSGKTRLAIEAATELVGSFRAGVFWVLLATVQDPRLVTETIARALGARRELAAEIGERELLLVLDNLEQVIDAAPALADLLEACPNLRLLVTSRELLRVRGEVEYRTSPLLEHEAVELFCTRARLAPDLAIEELCRALDNLPLAVELAAARAWVLSPAQILERIMQRLDLFKGGRDVHPRHRTLRATIEWSHDLLEPEERELFARLSVFAGGCTLEAAEAVTEVDLDVLQALVEKSLLRQSAERFWMLELIRGYAAERLEDGGTVEELRRRHAEHFVGFAERIEPELMRDRQAEWLELLDNDHSNARSALAFLLERGDFERTLRLVGALAMFWLKKGYLSEGRRWLEATLRATDGQRTAARAKALGGAALLASLQGDWPETARWGTEGRRLSLELGEPRYASTAMLTLGRALLATGEREGAIAQFEEAAASAVEAGNSDAIAMAAFNLGYAALDDGDLERARREFGRVV